MGKCEYLIDISPYDPLCDHPCRLYGGGAVEAECETCQYRIEDLERENTKLRELVHRLINHVEHPPCEGCNFEMNCDERVTQCDEWQFMVADARELGIEVSG